MPAFTLEPTKRKGNRHCDFCMNINARHSLLILGSPTGKGRSECLCKKCVAEWRKVWAEMVTRDWSDYD